LQLGSGPLPPTRVPLCLRGRNFFNEPLHREALTSIFPDTGKFYGVDPYTFLFASLMILILGLGYFAMDALIAKRFKEAA
jgi:hypothetical protein